MRRLWILALAIAVQGQPVDDGAPILDEYTPALVIAQAQAAYRAGPVADRVTVSLRSPAGRSRSAPLIVRLDAARADAGPAFRLELDETKVDELVVTAAGGVLIAANTDNENDRWIVESAGADIASILSHLPPLPVPQLQLAFGPSSFADPTPYTAAVSWHSAESVPAGPLTGEAGVILSGHGQAGPVQAVFDAQTFRLRSLRAELQGGSGLELESAAIDPGDPARWAIPSEGRRTVAAITDLTSQRGPIAPGQFVPDLTFSRLGGGGWNLHEALDALPPASPDGPAQALALILFRVPADPVQLATSEASARMGMLAVGQGGGGGPTISAYLVAAIELAAFGERRQGLTQRWGAGPAAPSWATPATSIDRFEPVEQAALVLIGPDRRLLATIALEDQIDAKAVADQIAEVVR